MVILIATLLRAAGIFTELWFDEICSIDYVQSTHSAWQALWSIHTDNKHHLIWLWIWVVGPHRAEWIYRLPSLIAGVALLPILYRVVKTESDQSAALIAMLLASFCYPLIFYSSEARGYSLATMLAVCAYRFAPDRSRRASATQAVLFSAIVVLGFLAHLTFVYVYAGLLVLMLIDFAKSPRCIVLLYHLPALMILTLIYHYDVRMLRYGGGPPTTAVEVIRYTIGMMTGSATEGPLDLDRRSGDAAGSRQGFGPSVAPAGCRPHCLLYHRSDSGSNCTDRDA